MTLSDLQRLTVKEAYAAYFKEPTGDEIAPGGVVDQSKLATVVDTLPLDLKMQLKAHCR